MNRKKSDLVWGRPDDNFYYLADKTRDFSNLGYVEDVGGDLFVAYVFEPLSRETYRELGFFDNIYDAKKAVEKTIPECYKQGG